MSPGVRRYDPAPQMEPLSLAEYQRILAVLRRDAALRSQERDRVNKLRSSLQTEGDDDRCPRCDTSSSGRRCSACARHREVKLQSGDWFYRHIQSRFGRTAPLPEYNKAHENGAAMDPDSAQVREFIERLVEALVSGQLDDVKVNRVYNHPEYDRMFSCHHTALCENLVRLSFALQMAIANKSLPEEDSPSAVHAALKQRVQRIIQEAMTLPNLKSDVPVVQNGNALHKWDDDITSMTYEDILATAILNKVIERFQQRTGRLLHDSVDGNSNLLSHSSPPASMTDQAPKYISRVEIGVNGSSNLDDGDLSSQEGPRSWSESSRTEPLSMTIEECIEEEVTTYDSAGEEEERSSDGMATTTGSELDFYLSGLNFIKQRRVPFPELGVDIVDGPKEDEYDEEEEHSESSQSPQPTDLISPVDSWEENWLFQRRRLKAGGASNSTQQSPMPVPMLVPNPSEDFRARIGDRDAEEVSDLSDCSDGALEDIVLAGVEFQEPTEVAETKTEVSEPQEQVLLAVPAVVESLVEEEIDITETTNMELVKASSVECLSEFGQQDSEYTEDYESVTQRQLSSLTEQVTPQPPVPKPRSLAVTPRQDKPAEEAVEATTQEAELATPPRPGTIAEREHRKWESAPPLPNNPYSPENISKRLSRQSTVYSSSRSSSATSFDFPEFKEEQQAASPLHVVCSSSEPDYKRYGRDYYINQSKSSSGERRSSSRVASPLLEQNCDEMNEIQQDVEAKTLTMNDEVTQLCGLVENEIAKWQKEINQTEEQWLKKLQQNGSIESLSPKQQKENTQNGSIESPSPKQQKGKTQNVSIESSSPKQQKEKTQNVSIESSSPKQQKENTQNGSIESPSPKQQKENTTPQLKNSKNSPMTNTSKLTRSKPNEVNEWRTPSECSTVSSDLDVDADVPIVLPSVKQLAKQFSGGGTSDSDSSVTKGLASSRRKPENHSKPMVIMEREKPTPSVREVHSLTARSISREFREGLRRNLPVQLDRNLHVAAPNSVEDSSCSSPELLVSNGTEEVKRLGDVSLEKVEAVHVQQKYSSIKETNEHELYNSDVEIISKTRVGDSTPGYTSDESGTRSPTPPFAGRRKLQNNIAFWEQLHRGGK
ncbi:uncharacterized protein [Periplaneta americana]|uniref:uncharacterized protein isoform X3 n=1 Tax=Periplaneta americana TaxID=6978 RepID=UPI0037E96560